MQSYLAPLGNKPCSSFSLPQLSPTCSLSLWFLLIVYKSIQVRERGGVCVLICVYAHACEQGSEVGVNVGVGGERGGVVWQTTCPYTWINLSSNETLWAGSEGCLEAPDYAAICRICLWLLLCHISYSQNPLFVLIPSHFHNYFSLSFCLASVIPLLSPQVLIEAVLLFMTNLFNGRFLYPYDSQEGGRKEVNPIC